MLTISLAGTSIRITPLHLAGAITRIPKFAPAFIHAQLWLTWRTHPHACRVETLLDTLQGMRTICREWVPTDCVLRLGSSPGGA